MITDKELHQAFLMASEGCSKEQILQVLGVVESTPELAKSIIRGVEQADGKSLFRQAVEDRNIDALIRFEEQICNEDQ